MYLAVLTNQYNTEQYPDPYKFIPERFDPKSEYYKSANGENRHPMSYVPFSFGNRKCLGMVFAIMEMKTILAYFVTKLEYEIPEELLNNPEVRYGIFTNFKLPLKIVKKL